MGDPVRQESVSVTGQLEYKHMQIMTNTLPHLLNVYTCRFPVCNLMEANALGWIFISFIGWQYKFSVLIYTNYAYSKSI